MIDIFILLYYKFTNLIKAPLNILGLISIFIINTIKSFEKPMVLLKLTVEQMFYNGIQSLPIVIISSASMGLVTVFQAEFQGRGIIPELYISTALVKATLQELAPLLTGLMLSGRIGAAMSAELGTMKVTEQIDSLSVMAINPYRYLVLPRLFATILVTPLLTIISIASSIIAGYFLAVTTMNILPVTFIQGMKINFSPVDLFGGLAKATVFGLIIGLSGTYNGFHAEGGAKGVGKATTYAVVTASLLILIADYIVARLIFK